MTAVNIAVLAVFVTLGVSALIALVVVRSRLQRELAAQAALAEEMAVSEALYRTTVDSLLDGIVIQDESGRIVRVNEAARQMLKNHLNDAAPTAGQVLAGSLPNLLNEHQVPFRPEERPVARALAGPDPVVGLLAALPSPDGLLWFRCNATATAHVSGRGRHVVLTFANVTEERRMATKIADQERRFRLALEHAPIGMALVSMSGELLTVNNALSELTGRSRDELFFYGFDTLIHPDDEPLGAEQLHRLVADGRDAFHAERRLLAADGSTVHVRIAMSVVRSDDDRSPYFIAEFLDTTETVRAARAQRSALALEQDVVAQLLALEDARTTLVSTVSHELRTPLTSLVGYLELLEDGTAGELSDEQRMMVDAGVRNGRRLERLIDDLLTISTTEQHHDGCRSERIDVATLVHGVVETMSPLADQAGITLVTEIGHGETTVIGDAAELERVLINLVGNSVKFTPVGGTVSIRSCVRCDERSWVQVAVTDTGVGIPDHEQDRLFTKFFRATAAHRDQVPGTGLGLAIVDKLVEAHGGTITLESIENVGTTVTIRLPTEPSPSS